MWKLTIDPSFEKEYLARFKTDLVNHIINGMGGVVLSKTNRKKLISDYSAKTPKNLKKIETLLVGKPNEAYELNNRIMKSIFSDYDENNLDTLKPHKATLKVIEKVFNYGGEISSNKENSYWLAHKVGHNTCTYCNRQYTLTVDSKESGEHIARPQFDHWFPKEVFPLLSLNLYNLIPSCPICNSSVKGSVVFSLNDYVHPYLQTADDPDFKFTPKVSDKDDSEWSVSIERVKGGKEDNTIKAFCLDDLYDTHGDLEVKDLMDFATGYTDNYLRELFDKVLADYSIKGFSKADVFRMLFGAEYIPSKFLDRPFSKMKKDILEYLHII